MHRQLDRVRAGLLDPQSFKLSESVRRASNLGASLFTDVEWVHLAGINTLAIDNINGSFLLSGSADGSLCMHDLRNFSSSPHHTCKLIHAIVNGSSFAHRYSVDTIQWYPFDAGYFVSSGMDKKLKVWDTEHMTPVECINFKGKIFQHNICPVPSQSTSLIALATSLNQGIVIDVRSGSNTHELRGHSCSIYTCKWSPTIENMLVTGGADNKILLWDIRTIKRSLKALDQHNGSGRSSNESSFTAHDGAVNGLCFTRNGMFLLSYGTDNRLRMWNSSTGLNEMVNYGSIKNEARKAVQIDVSICSVKELVYVPSESDILVYSLRTGNRLKSLSGHFNLVNCCSFHPYRLTLFSGSNDKIILCWACETVEEDCEENDRMEFVSDDEWLTEDDNAG